MFKLQKHKSQINSRDKIDFRFSDFKGIKIPKGWDKLFISVVQVDTGKTIVKSGKTVVRNKTCSWTDTFCESIYISQENGESKENGDYFKFVVMGPSRSGVLGEVTIDLENYLSTRVITPLSLQLEKCHYGTLLQFSLQCLTPKQNYRNVQKKEVDQNGQYGVSNYYDKKDAYNDTFVNDIGSTSINHLESDSLSQVALNKINNFVANDGKRSHDTLFHSKTEKSLSLDGNIKEQNSTIDLSSPISDSGTSNELLEVDEDTIEEDNVLKQPQGCTTKVLVYGQEFYDFKKENDNLKCLPENSTILQAATDDLNNLIQDMDGIHKEMEEETRILKEKNADLVEQLEKAQESNIELLSILQELEVIVESQKLEIDDLSSQKRKLEESVNIDPNKELSLCKTSEDPVHIPLEIDNIKLQLQQLQVTQEELESAIQLLEKTVLEKDNEIERLQDLRAQHMSDIESKWLLEVAGKEDEIIKLETKLAEAIKKYQNKDSKEENLELDLKFEEPNHSKPRKDVSSSETLVSSLCSVHDPIKIDELPRQLKQKEANEIKSRDKNLIVGKCFKDDEVEELHNEDPCYLRRCASCDSNMGIVKFSQGVYNDLNGLKVEVLKSNNLRQTEEIKDLRKIISSLEDQIEIVRNENQLLKASIQSMERERDTYSNSVEDFKKRMSSELKKGKQDVEKHLNELEMENMELLERILSLEGQQRYLTNEKEMYFVKLQNSESQQVNLRDEIKRLETEVDTHRIDMRQRLEIMRTKWIEVQEECDYLKKANPKMQSIIENLIEECNSLQKINGGLKRDNVEMHTRCSMMESKLKDCQVKFFGLSQKIDALEDEFSNLLEEIPLKEQGLNSELNSLIFEDRLQREKVMHEHISLNDMYSQKVVEVESLQRELVHLIDQIFIVHGEKETLNSDTLLELSTLRSDKAKLEIVLQEIQGEFALCQKKLRTLVLESEAKILELTKDLMASRKNEEVLMVECEKLSVCLENVKNNNEIHTRIISRQEITLKESEYERQQLANEISALKEKMQRLMLLQDELVALKTSLNNSNFEYARVNTCLDQIRRDHELLEKEKYLLLQKISSMEKDLLDLEDCKSNIIILQEKINRLEEVLATKEASYLQDAKLKFQVERLMSENNELQRRIKYLEQDLTWYLNKIVALEQPLKHNIQTQVLINSKGRHSKLVDTDVEATTKYEENLLTIESNHIDDLSKIRSLENELLQVWEENDMYKTQLKRFLSEDHNISADTPKTFSIDNNSSFKILGKKSSIEVELKDLQEKYFQMSLRFAEVEAQREELVLKLKSKKKSKNNKKGWFSR